MPLATMGGVSMILYGMISAVGVRNVVENQVDFTNSRNVIIAAIIMVLAIGIAFSKAGAIVIPAGEASPSACPVWQWPPWWASSSTPSCPARTTNSAWMSRGIPL